jgi:hypothetical protein
MIRDLKFSGGMRCKSTPSVVRDRSVTVLLIWYAYVSSEDRLRVNLANQSWENIGRSAARFAPCAAAPQDW